jgi:signal transduction histidine kinase/purine-cytosine permease-like protein
MVSQPPTPPPQQVITVRRDYNRWVASETLEDYALRFTPRSFRKWSPWRVANTAFGAASFLILEAVGATLLVQYGFVNAVWAILVSGVIIFLAGLPISVVAARHGVDMDLLTRGAGFGYLGSTITSLIYASFTFIFFALEAAVMAYALELAFDIPPAWGYGICALVVIPLVTHGVTAISRLQVWTQPLWLVLLVLPLVVVLTQAGDDLAGLTRHAGVALPAGQGGGFQLIGFGAALTVGMALITQIGEQADYLRFMPEAGPAGRGDGRVGRRTWWLATLLGGPGWVVLGAVKMLAGVLLAWLALQHMVPADRAVDPNQMYLVAWEYVFPNYGWAVAATALFVVVSQLKINVTNAYAGSLAWSNFFSRLTHSHPGRVVWVVFNTAIALVLMELDVFQALGHVLGLFSNIAIAWIMVVVADLVINKPLGLSPPGIEFRRAHLHDINPVGVGAMALASVLSMAAHLGAFGALAQAFSAMIALVVAVVATPLIAWATGGRYYLAQRSSDAQALEAALAAGAEAATGDRRAVRRCTVCERDYEPEDMAACPAYGGPVCSLCCTLEARCGDLCKPQGRVTAQWLALLKRLLPRRMAPQLEAGLAHYLLLMCAVVPALALLLAGLHGLGLRSLQAMADAATAAQLAPLLRSSFLQAFAVLLMVAGMVAWWLVLAQRSRVAAQDESRRQTQTLHAHALALHDEISSHRHTDAQLQAAKASADAANQAKSRYVTAISHELRTPLNSIMGYAQLLEDDPTIPAHRRDAVRTIRRGGDHLLGLIEGTLDIARIESGRLALEPQPVHLHALLDDLVQLVAPQATARGLRFVQQRSPGLPTLVRADEKRLRQILLNLLGNAVKFTRSGQVAFSVEHAREMARFEIVDTGPGMDPDELQRVFEPFERGSAAGGDATGGTGLGLTITRMLTQLMGGELLVHSQPGQGSRFTVRLYLPTLRPDALPASAGVALRPTGYSGPRLKLLVVDNEEADRRLLVDRLAPLGFELRQAGSGEAALALLAVEPVDAIFLDLAMPGVDGWTTLRRIRQARLSDAPAAIVSANAFDRGLDNDLGIAPQDFMVKPVGMAALLGWLDRRLGPAWLHAPAAAPALARPPLTLQWPPVGHLLALQQDLRLGYMRGIQRQLDTIARDHPACQAWVDQQRGLARGFQLDTMQRAVDAALAAAEATSSSAAATAAPSSSATAVATKGPAPGAGPAAP